MKCFEKKACQMVSVVLSAALLMPQISACAVEPNTSKEEVVYINLHSDGSVKEINVVNIFDPEQDGQIVDYGNYKSLRNMTSTDELHQSGDQITVDAASGKLYYEGRLDQAVMPWNIEIHYFLDGREYPAEELAGKSGALKIKVDIMKNTACKGDFFEGYALQTTLLLDTKKCTNIAAEDATIANVGSKKQLTYTILPNKGADFVITADVVDFEMDAISINGIPLHLNIEVDDEELMERVTELTDAIEKIDDGTGEVNEGVSELQERVKNDLQNGVHTLHDGAGLLQNGAGSLKNGGQFVVSGTKTLESGAKTLDDGVQSLNTGISQVQAGLDALDAQSDTLTGGSAQIKDVLVQLQTALNDVSASAEELQELSAASSELQKGIAALSDGASQLEEQCSFAAYKTVMKQNGLDIDTLQSGNRDVLNSVNKLLERVDTIEQIATDAGIPAAVISPIKNKCVSLANQFVSLLKGNIAAIDGMELYLNGLHEGANELADGAQNLKTKYDEFDEAIDTLVNTLTELLYQMTAMKDAVNLLVEEYSKLDSGLGAYTEGVAQIVAGYGRISDGATNLAQGSSQLANGSSSLYDGTKTLLEGIIELYDATGTLKDGTGQLDEGAAELLAGVAQLYAGTGELKDGTSAMREETSGMDAEIDEKIEALLDDITGGDRTISSFVSDKNENVKSVQFVIQTGSIQTPDEEEIPEEKPENTTIWQKFKSLFSS